MMRIGLIIATALSTSLLVVPAAHAAGEGSTGGGGKAPTPSKAPIGAPPAANSAELNSAYEFRSRMSSDPVCQDLARQSDSVYMNAEVESDKKKQALDQIRNRAKAAGCF
jgi:hypothetical protein